jgi:hypothetical protein
MSGVRRYFCRRISTWTSQTAVCFVWRPAARTVCSLCRTVTVVWEHSTEDATYLWSKDEAALRLLHLYGWGLCDEMHNWKHEEPSLRCGCVMLWNWRPRKLGSISRKKVKVFRYKPDVAVGVPGGWGSWIFSTFGTMKVVRSSPLRTGRLHPQEFSWYSFLEAESTPGHMVLSVASENIPSDTTGDRSRDLPTSSAVP